MYDSNVLVAYGKIPKMDGFTELHDFENKLQKTKYISTDEIVPYFTEDMKFTIATYGLISNG